MMNLNNVETNNTNEVTNYDVTMMCTADYLREMFAKECEEFQKLNKVKSGYRNLDAETNIYPGLYVIGAISSLGKTTFLYQMCDQMAQRGEKILYFSFEQTRRELVTKSLARTMAKTLGVNKALSAIEISDNHLDERVTKSIVNYFETAKNMNIIECDFYYDFGKIEKAVLSEIEAGYKPIVVIDYLQVVQPADSNISAKERIDEIVKKLKQLQKNHNLVAMVISSINRTSYLSPIDYESFKESGGIEYTADVLLGLDYQVMHSTSYEELKSKNDEKRKMLNAAKASKPRKIQLVNLKNRFGAVGYTCDFNYYPHRDLFVAVEDGKEVDYECENEELKFD